MSSKRRRYDREFKLEAVKLVVDHGRSVNDVAESLGVPAGSLHLWKRNYLSDGSGAFPGHGKLKTDDEEIRKLKKDLRRVRQERDILKKAVGYFASDKR